jgi:hypothetical protein
MEEISGMYFLLKQLPGCLSKEDGAKWISRPWLTGNGN